MNINAELYRVFGEVAKVGTFSGAAAVLGITQPAVSQAVKQLEDALGAKLFTRSSRGVTLTGEGELLSGYVRSAMGLLKEGEERLGKLRELSAGEIRIGAGDTVSRWFLLPMIERFHERFPDVKVSITNRTSDRTLELIRNGSLDIGFVNMPMSERGFIFEECLPVHDIFVAGERFADLRGRQVTPEELAGYPIIMLERASNSRRMVDRHFLSSGVALHPEIELGAHDLLPEYAKIGLGIACVTREFVDLESSGLFEVRLTNPVPRRSIAVCYSANIQLPKTAKQFISLVKGV